MIGVDSLSIHSLACFFDDFSFILLSSSYYKESETPSWWWIYCQRIKPVLEILSFVHNKGHTVWANDLQLDSIFIRSSSTELTNNTGSPHGPKEDMNATGSIFEHLLPRLKNLIKLTGKWQLGYCLKQWRNQVGARGALRPPWNIFWVILGKFAIQYIFIVGKWKSPCSEI